MNNQKPAQPERIGDATLIFKLSSAEQPTGYVFEQNVFDENAKSQLHVTDAAKITGWQDISAHIGQPSSGSTSSKRVLVTFQDGNTFRVVGNTAEFLTAVASQTPMVAKTAAPAFLREAARCDLDILNLPMDADSMLEAASHPSEEFGYSIKDVHEKRTDDGMLVNTSAMLTIHDATGITLAENIPTSRSDLRQDMIIQFANNMAFLIKGETVADFMKNIGAPRNAFLMPPSNMRNYISQKVARLKSDGQSEAMINDLRQDRS